LFVTEIFCFFYSGRRQDFAAGRTKNHKGGNIFKIKYWMYAATGGPKMKWGAHILNEEQGTTDPHWRRPCF